jgi:2-polyprenyl-6-methoxyphenol hydroxylase-like FAD-dependent oxidoreductase
MFITIAGAGIGGLTAALSLHAAGLKCRVLEAVRHPKPLGAGINLLPHAVRELTELGLGEDLARAAIPTAEMVHVDRFGNRIWSAARGLAAGYHWPQYSIHRGELQTILWSAVVDRLGPDAVRTGLAVERFTQPGDAVELEFRDRETGLLRTLETDVLIGADGIHSAVRAQLHPGEGRPRWNGIHMWRGVTEAGPFLGGRTMIVAGSNRRAKFVAYPISRRAEEQGQAAVNWVAEVLLEPGAVVAPESWNRKARLEAVLPHFATFRFEWLDVPALIAGAPAIFEYPMVDRDPLPAWGSGRVTLLGDAAHPMYPVGSNGGSQAIIDARVLAWELARTDDPVAALAAYEEVRRPATSAMVLSSREMGPEGVLARVEERAPHGFARIEDVLRSEELWSLSADYRALTGSDADTLNHRPSWTPAACRARLSVASPPPTTTRSASI